MKSNAKFNRYDVPMRAIQDSLNEVVGKGWLPFAYIRQAWQFYQGGEGWGASEALFKAIALWPESVETEYRPGTAKSLELWVRVNNVCGKV